MPEGLGWVTQMQLQLWCIIWHFQWHPDLNLTHFRCFERCVLLFGPQALNYGEGCVEAYETLLHHSLACLHVGVVCFACPDKRFGSPHWSKPCSRMMSSTSWWFWTTGIRAVVAIPPSPPYYPECVKSTEHATLWRFSPFPWTMGGRGWVRVGEGGVRVGEVRTM